ncbi:MAG: hypothetical protein N2506_02610 [Dehalococcoidales bacterium]|nr:hypothetical protein [Dehalococcoidales bacterium]
MERLKWFVLVPILCLPLLTACRASVSPASPKPSPQTPPPITSPAASAPSPSPVSPSSPAASSSSPASSAAATGPSEQPDSAAFKRYFKELGLGRMPAEVTNPPEQLERNVHIFAAGDQICLYGEIIRECRLRTAIYETSVDKLVRESGLPQPMSGGFAGWEPVDLSPGEYEYRVYVGETLVAVFPFEVR